jgi:hypothetical protein
LLEWDKEYDFAICSIEVEESIQRGKLSPDTLRDGQRLRILGTAGSGNSRQFQGVFGGFRRPMGGDPWDWFEIKGCAVRTGDSGGAVYADDGKVVGIVFGSSDALVVVLRSSKVLAALVVVLRSLDKAKTNRSNEAYIVMLSDLGEF